MHKKGSEINILICFDTTSFFQCLVHIICWEGVWKSCPEVCGIQKSIMYHSNLLYMFYLFLFKILFIYTQLNSLLSMVLGHFIIYEILTEGSWLKCRGYRMFFTHGKKETKHIKIFSKFPNGLPSIWWGPSPLLWSLF